MLSDGHFSPPRFCVLSGKPLNSLESFNSKPIGQGDLLLRGHRNSWQQHISWRAACAGVARLEGRVTQKTAILITGMHRSGTSALARFVSLLGARLPDALIPANAGNPEGHWEPKAVVELNDRMLADAGSDVYSIADFNREWFQTARAMRFRTEAAALIESAFEGDPFIVLKDPRTALLLPIWEDALSTLNYRTVHILPLRSPRDVASSLRRRHLKDFPYDGWAPPRGELVWLRYTLAAVLGTRSSPRVFVRYDDLLSDWREEARRIAAETGIAWPRLGSLEAERAIDSFLHEPSEPGTGTIRADDEAQLSTLSPSMLAERLYQTIAVAGDDRATIDAIASEFTSRIASMSELIAAFEAMYPIVWRYYEEANRSGAQVEAARRTEAGMHQAVQSLWANLNKQTDDKGSLRQLLESTSERARSFEAAFEQRAADLSRREAEFAFEREELKKLATDLRSMFDHEASVRADAELGREALRSHAAELQAMLEQELARRQGAEESLQIMRDHAAELQRLMEQERGDHDVTRDQLAVTRDQVAALEQILSKVRASWSWRLAGPARVAMRWARGKAGR